MAGGVVLCVLVAASATLGVGLNVKPAWKRSACVWSTNSMECMNWVSLDLEHKLNTGDPITQCDRSTIKSETDCLANKHEGNACNWNQHMKSCQDEEVSCFYMVTEEQCQANPRCEYRSERCAYLKCRDYNDSACVQDALGVGPCRLDNGCRELDCSHFNSSSCKGTKVDGKGPGQGRCGWMQDWKSETMCAAGDDSYCAGTCAGVSVCSNYRNAEDCIANPAGLNDTCTWSTVPTSGYIDSSSASMKAIEGCKSKSMVGCKIHVTASACESDSQKFAEARHPYNQCWWEHDGKSLVVGAPVVFPESDHFYPGQTVETEGTIIFDAEKRLVNILDVPGGVISNEKEALMGNHLDGGHFGFFLKENKVSEILGGDGVAVSLTQVPNPIPTGYTIRWNGLCGDTLPGIGDLIDHAMETGKHISCEEKTTPSECGPTAEFVDGGVKWGPVPPEGEVPEDVVLAGEGVQNPLETSANCGFSTMGSVLLLLLCAAHEV